MNNDSKQRRNGIAARGNSKISSLARSANTTKRPLAGLFGEISKSNAVGEAAMIISLALTTERGDII